MEFFIEVATNLKLLVIITKNSILQTQFQIRPSEFLLLPDYSSLEFYKNAYPYQSCHFDLEQHSLF